MPRAFLLTYDKALRQWVKVIGGRKFYFGLGKTKGDQADYQRALERYRKFMSQLGGESGQTTAQLTPRQMEGTATTAPPSNRRKYSPRLVPMVARQFLNFQESRVGSPQSGGGISAARVASIGYFLKPFIEHCSGISISKVNVDTLNSYRESLLLSQKTNRTSPHTTYQRFAIAKLFLNWCWQNEKINQLPRNIRSALQYGLPRPDTLHFFDWRKGRGGEEVQTLISECRSRDSFLELYVLLALNCGFQHQDISDLRMNEVRWRRRDSPAAIERLRSKSGVYSRHILWDRTLELFKQHAKGRYNTPDLCFTRSDGKPLVTKSRGRSSIPIKNRLMRVIRSAFPRDSRSFTHLRKTGAAYCAERFPGLRVEVLYLAHSPQDMASRFYAHTSHAKLDEALCYMECDFGLTERVVKRFGSEPSL
jgi:integrase